VKVIAFITHHRLPWSCLCPRCPWRWCLRSHFLQLHSDFI
jgi:hypothetical protein